MFQKCKRLFTYKLVLASQLLFSWQGWRRIFSEGRTASSDKGAEMRLA